MSTTQPDVTGSPAPSSAPLVPAEASAVPTPTGGILLAPRGRRRDHVLVALVGAVLAPASLALCGLAASASLSGDWPMALVLVVGLVLLCASTQALFAARSSMGPLVTGAVALVAQGLVLASPGGTGAAPFAWARTLLPSGLLLVLAGLMLGGSWAMHQARAAGREQARHAMAQAVADRTLGVTPVPPPARRRAHVVSLPVVVATVVGALGLLRHHYGELVTGVSSLASWQRPAVLACALVLLVAGAAAAGRSTLGARVLGPLLVVSGLPLVLVGLVDLPGRDTLASLLPWDVSGVGLVGTGVLLSSVGWGVHGARRQGRDSETRLRRAEAAAQG